MLIVLVALCPVTQTISPEERAFSGRRNSSADHSMNG